MNNAIPTLNLKSTKSENQNDLFLEQSSDEKEDDSSSESSDESDDDEKLRKENTKIKQANVKFELQLKSEVQSTRMKDRQIRELQQIIEIQKREIASLKSRHHEFNVPFKKRFRYYSS